MSGRKVSGIVINIPAGVDIVGNNPIRQILAAIEPTDNPIAALAPKPERSPPAPAPRR